MFNQPTHVGWSGAPTPQMRLGQIDREAELRAEYPIGTLVNHDEYGEAVFTVVDYWRGGLRLEEPKFHTTHVADVRHVQKIAPTAKAIRDSFEAPTMWGEAS